MDHKPLAKRVATDQHARSLPTIVPDFSTSLPAQWQSKERARSAPRQSAVIAQGARSALPVVSRDSEINALEAQALPLVVGSQATAEVKSLFLIPWISKASASDSRSLAWRASSIRGELQLQTDNAECASAMPFQVQASRPKAIMIVRKTQPEEQAFVGHAIHAITSCQSCNRRTPSFDSSLRIKSQPTNKSKPPEGPSCLTRNLECSRIPR